MELKVQHFLRNGGTLEQLRRPPYELIIKEWCGLVCLKYTQGRSDEFCEIVKECRGLILEKGTWNVVCHPFHRFFNYGQPAAATLQGPLQCFQKLDGSLVKVYNYRGQWFCASSGTIDGQGYIEDSETGGKVRFFWLVYDALGAYDITWDDFTKTLDPTKTYMYELCTPKNVVVIPHNDYKLYYLGERSNITGQEEYNEDPRISNPKIYDLNNLSEILSASNSLPLSEEGFVVVDGNFNRLKVKNPAYLRAHYLHHNGKPNYLDIVVERNEEEYLTYFPHHRGEIAKAKELLSDLTEEANYYSMQVSAFAPGCPDADCALKIQKYPRHFQRFLFYVANEPDTTWEDYTSFWDVNMWKHFLKQVNIGGQ